MSDRFAHVSDQEPAPQQPETPAEGLRTHEIGNRTYIVADVSPLDVDGPRTVAVGSILFLVAFFLLLPFYGSLADDDRTWWLWTCLAGFGLGVIGWGYCRRGREPRSRLDAAPPSRLP